MSLIFSDLESAKDHIAENALKIMQEIHSSQLYVRQALYMNGTKNEFQIVGRRGNCDIIVFDLFKKNTVIPKLLKQINYNNDYKL